ncbi:MAG: hypothetical protein U5N86_06940 [Planctomycetota bacterium]|nr:hypothetical protein [Planctomycetota bacterium]
MEERSSQDSRSAFSPFHSLLAAAFAQFCVFGCQILCALAIAGLLFATGQAGNLEEAAEALKSGLYMSAQLAAGFAGAVFAVVLVLRLSGHDLFDYLAIKPVKAWGYVVPILLAVAFTVFFGWLSTLLPHADLDTFVLNLTADRAVLAVVVSRGDIRANW